MKLAAIMPIRNEDWVCGLSIRVALRYADIAIVLNHASTDRSEEIIREISAETRRIIWCQLSNPAWDEMAHRNSLLTIARQEGATHICMVDADEIVSGNLDPQTIRTLIGTLGKGQMLSLPGYNLRGGIDKYHSNGIWGQRWFSFAFTDNQKLGWSGDKFHQREPGGCNWRQVQPIAQGFGGIMHLWGASERRLRAKHRAYRITERLRWPDKPVAEIERMYSLFDTPSADPRHEQRWTFDTVPESWWAPYSEWMQYLDVDAEPWQEAWCNEMIAKHGREKFKGLRV